MMLIQWVFLTCLKTTTRDDKDLQLKPLESQDYDVILSSAGVSVGDKDFFKDALKEKTPFFIMKKSISNLESR